MWKKVSREFIVHGYFPPTNCAKKHGMAGVVKSKCDSKIYLRGTSFILREFEAAVSDKQDCSNTLNVFLRKRLAFVHLV